MAKQQGDCLEGCIRDHIEERFHASTPPSQRNGELSLCSDPDFMEGSILQGLCKIQGNGLILTDNEDTFCHALFNGICSAREVAQVLEDVGLKRYPFIKTGTQPKSWMIPGIRGEILDKGDSQIFGCGMEFRSNILLPETILESFAEVLQFPVVVSQKNPFAIIRCLRLRKELRDIFNGCGIVKYLYPGHGSQAPGCEATFAAT
ncbi:MAG: hypothetical protein ABSD81_08120 [Methanomicrobiales archaeon]